jgi:tetratricopeptide (TPR) repeat protein
MEPSTYKQLFDQAIEAGVKRDYLKASTLLLRIVSETDEFPQAYLYLGRSYHALGNFDLAIQFLKYYLEIAPDVGAGHFFLGRAYLSRGIPSLAAHELGIAVELEPNNGQAAALLGLSFLRSKRSDLASEHLGRAVELDPENRELYSAYLNTLVVDAIKRYRSGSLDMARQMFAFLHEAGYEGPLPLLYLAALEKEAANYQEALHWYDRVILFKPDDPLLHIQRAGVLQRMGRTSDAAQVLIAFGFGSEDNRPDWDSEEISRYIAAEAFGQGHMRKAILFAKNVIKQNGPDYDMHVLLGEAFRNLQSFNKAENHFSRAHELDRKKIEPIYGFAMIHWHHSEYEEMLVDLDTIERIDPGNSIGAYYRALCYSKLNRNPADAVGHIQNALKKNKPDQYLLTALGREYLRDSRADLADKWFNKALEIDTAYQPAHVGLLATYEALENTSKGAEAYERYISSFPADVNVRKGYIHLLLELKNYDIAIKQLHAAASYLDGDLEMERLMAYCCRQTGQFREASVIYKNLLKADPKNEQYLRSLVYCLEASDNRKTSIDLLANAFKFLKPSVDLRLIYGVLLFREKQDEKALAEFRLVLEDSKHDWRAYKNIAMVYQQKGIQDFADKFLAKAEKYKNPGGTGLVDTM